MLISTRMLSFFLSLIVIMNGGAAVACREEQKSGGTERKRGTEIKPNPEATVKKEEGSDVAVRVLQEGSYGPVKDAFIIVARDEESFAQLRQLITDLPEMETGFFRNHAVIAAFLGTRRTGGYGIEVRLQENGRTTISERTPPPDAMTTMAFTSPFKIVALRVEDKAQFNIELDTPWKAAMRPYRVTSGELSVSGGIAGRTQKFKVGGELRVVRYKDFVTFDLDLKSDSARSNQTLKGLVSGIVKGENEFSISGVQSESFIDPPHGALILKGAFKDDDNNLALTFETAVSNVPDGFSGRGSLTAVATAPPPKKSVPGESGNDPM